MKKIIGSLTFIFIISIITISCESTETYADKLEKESKAINRLFDKNKFKRIDKYPKNGVFAANEFYRDPQTGVYFNVVDSGNGKRASAAERTEIFVRYKQTYRLLYSDTIAYSNAGQYTEIDWISFNYGLANSYTDYSQTATSNYMFKSEGMVVPLSYVGENAIIKLIVPFDFGSGYQRNQYEPVYFGYLKYTFEKRQEVEEE